ncbi:redoxin domain-containing protein [Mucilaginibacter sp. UYCu711]|uniref:redoxin domain-containing protein n=1 Tax=Mucilaginibacter sp. UYCu711 TaxID=3156339 RepID=UPI003D1E96C7
MAQIPVRKGPASAEEIKQAREVLDADMNSLSKHRAFIFAMGISSPLVVEQYREWMKKYPDNVNIPLSAGTVYYNAEMSQGKEFLEKAATMQPHNAKIWGMLSGDAFTRGQYDLRTEYLKKAYLIDTSNADYAASYLMSFKDSDPDYKTKVFNFIKRFPTSERGAQVLYWFAEQTTNITDKINYFEKLRTDYPPQHYEWSSSGMVPLADAYLQTDPGKALRLINEMGGEGGWKIRKQVAELLIGANVLERDQNYKEAMSKLNLIVLPKFNYVNEYIAFKKASLLVKIGNVNNVKIAYDSLAQKFSKLPSDDLYTALEFYGNKIGKDSKQILKDVNALRDSAVVIAYQFELGLYTDKGKLSLKSLKGKVVLLTFWFPACGPCRAEFPHFQAVINKFKGKNVVYVGINVLPEQDPYVIPMLKNTKYSFIPLRGSREFAAKYYGVDGEPTNFLIDKTGKIIFSDFRIDNSNQRTLELMISSLL